MNSLLRLLITSFIFVFLTACGGGSGSGPAAPVAPTITSFAPSASTILAGSSVNLTAVFANGTGSIDGVGAVTTGVAKSVSPTSTTTYTLTVTNTAGAAVTSTVTVTVESLTVTVSTVDIKTVKFSWNAITSATSYKLYVNPTGGSGFVVKTDNITGTETELTLPVHFTDWVNATYMVEAYNSTTKLVSTTAISITSEMLNTIGYVKNNKTPMLRNYFT